MKKLIYTILAVSTIFTSCTKDDEVEKASIVGVWSATSAKLELSESVKESLSGQVVSEYDSTLTISPGDDEWEFDGDIEFTADGKRIEGFDTVSYTYSGNVLIEFYEDEYADTSECIVTSTTIKMIVENTEEYEFESEGSTFINSSNQKITINGIRN